MSAVGRLVLWCNGLKVAQRPRPQIHDRQHRLSQVDLLLRPAHGGIGIEVKGEARLVDAF